jgi:periplasmic protein CpxP/Spy
LFGWNRALLSSYFAEQYEEFDRDFCSMWIKGQNLYDGSIEIKHTSNHLSTTMIINKLVKFLPLLAIVVAVPTFAASNYNHAQPQPVGYLAENPMDRYLDGLNLTPEQKTKVQQLRNATKAQMDAVFTPEQRQKLAQIRAEHQANKPNKAAWNLTADQKTKLKAIRQTSMEQMKAILTPEQQAQLRQSGDKKPDGEHFGRLGGHMARFDKLNLTAEQKTKLEQLLATTRTQMDTVFTPEQRQQAKLHQEQHRAIGDKWKSLNLTADQQTKLKEIRRSSKVQFEAILTPEQQQQAKQKHSRRGGHWGHGDRQQRATQRTAFGI